MTKEYGSSPVEHAALHILRFLPKRRIKKIDLDAYKEKQMKRRIDTLIAKNKIVGYENYVAALKANNRMFEEFVNYLTINVSEFYRNPDQWQIMDREIISAYRPAFAFAITCLSKSVA